MTTTEHSFDFSARAMRVAMERVWKTLCRDIGERRAGTDEERRAAEFIAGELAACGIENVRLEVFPCTSLREAFAEVHELSGKRWRRVEAAPLVGAPPTPGRRAIDAELVWLELPEEAHRLTPGSLDGRVLAWFGPLPTDPAVHRRLIAARPSAVIHVDERLPFSWVKNDGVYPFWTRRHGMPPTLTVPYADAWRWRRDGVKRVRVRVRIEQVAAPSRNVIAELPGADSTLPAIALTAHHDTQCGNPGADDNASGVVCLLALARTLAPMRLRRTVRFLSFGTEEQLSVGADHHVRKHRVAPADTGLVVNFDSVSSPLGHFGLSVAGGESLARHAVRALAKRGLAVQLQREITPFADQFPFNRAGVPSLYFFRSNFSGGRWQHHSRYDSLDNVSLAPISRMLDAAAPLIAELAERRSWPFSLTLPANQRHAARKLGRDLFG
ncbi:MAG TPA: M28 family peptidase [Opitutaceae bacterium]|nr:M28 family peptidase [Opitutaceae bacterium]